MSTHHFLFSAALSGVPTSRLYQGVRVKEPVKELLRRKRGNAARRTTSPFTDGNRAQVVVPSNTLPSCTHTGLSRFVDTCKSAHNDSAVNDSGLCKGWIAQTTNTTSLQPLSHWLSSDWHHYESSILSHTDVYVQPVCPGYTVVGPSPLLTFAQTPLVTNLTNMSTSTLPKEEAPESSLTCLPWSQPLSTNSAQIMQVPSVMPQLFPLPLTLPVLSPEPDPQQDPEGTLTLEKLLEEDGSHRESFICSSPLSFSEDI
ncbi:hypothetical protein DNTS_000613 [Danionella cerebrum]|uniref:OCA domain-containing protein n=1 Tax=Danionella cerebrum TaxID=2873325 RepID=A0A553R7W4_9TELE|nr:hypothetical protein DNTS_000613 [Danionella translucida]